MTKIQSHLTTAFSTIITAASSALILAPSVSAQGQAWSGECIEKGDVATIRGLECLVANVLGSAITIIGLAGFVMLLIGAFRLMTSNGDAKATASARTTITFAALGLLVALAAFIILNLIWGFAGFSENNTDVRLFRLFFEG